MWFRSLLVVSAAWLGCSEPSPPKPELGDPNEILLEPSGELPRFRIRAEFSAGLDAPPHIQPVAAALVAARAICCPPGGPVKPGATAAVHLEVRARSIHAESRNATGACFARALDGKPIDDATTYVVELLVSVG
jgi:hypothetical protein